MVEVGDLPVADRLVQIPPAVVEARRRDELRLVAVDALRRLVGNRRAPENTLVRPRREGGRQGPRHAERLLARALAHRIAHAQRRQIRPHGRRRRMHVVEENKVDCILRSRAGLDRSPNTEADKRIRGGILSKNAVELGVAATRRDGRANDVALNGRRGVDKLACALRLVKDGRLQRQPVIVLLVKNLPVRIVREVVERIVRHARVRAILIRRRFAKGRLNGNFDNELRIAISLPAIDHVEVNCSKTVRIARRIDGRCPPIRKPAHIAHDQVRNLC